MDKKEACCPVCQGDRDLLYPHCWRCQQCGWVAEECDRDALVEDIRDRLLKFYDWYGKKEVTTAVKVKTVYANAYKRAPDITEYPSKGNAESFVEHCRKWGIGIVSCDIIE